MSIQKKINASKMIMLASMILCFVIVSVSQGAQETPGPMEIKSDVSCGKCGMFPAKYPKWQTQIIFTDGSMTPFDGCKCMFGFLNNMGKYDQKHSAADVAAIWVREFNTGDWIDAKTAHYVIGSDEMGPMGKELIPFADAAAAETFQKDHGGELAMYDSITMETLKPLMGKMHMKDKMMKQGEMMKGEMQGHMEK